MTSEVGYVVLGLSCTGVRGVLKWGMDEREEDEMASPPNEFRIIEDYKHRPRDECRREGDKFSGWFDTRADGVGGTTEKICVRCGEPVVADGPAATTTPLFDAVVVEARRDGGLAD